jgi:hypothetical protein
VGVGVRRGRGPYDSIPSSPPPSRGSWDGRLAHWGEWASWGPAQLIHFGEVCGQRWPLVEQEVDGQEWSRVW